MALELNFGGKYTASYMQIKSAVINFDNVFITTNWVIYGDKQERDDGEKPKYELVIIFQRSQLVLTEQIKNMRSMFETALRNRCEAENNDPNLNSGNRIPVKIRTAVVNSGDPVPDIKT